MIAASSPPVRRIAALSLIFGLALLAAACGRRGPLEPPQAAVAAPTPAPSANADLGEQLGKPKNPPITPPKRDFVLDPLL